MSYLVYIDLLSQLQFTVFDRSKETRKSSHSHRKFLQSILTNRLIDDLIGLIDQSHLADNAVTVLRWQSLFFDLHHHPFIYTV